jgi:flavin-dependent dehydrogenase
MEVDALVVGAGVSGCALTIALQSYGLKTVILERAAPHSTRVGEHLSPDACPSLKKLGLWEPFTSGAHLPCPAVRASWGAPDLFERDYIFSPYGSGWNLDRSRFDASLVRASVAAGAVVWHNARVKTLTAQETGWSVEAVVAGRSQHITAAFLVDATGRAATIARKLGAKQVVHDHLIALIGWLRAGDGANTVDATLLIEAVTDGWWYAMLLPDERLVAAFMTYSPLPLRSRDKLTDFWADQMKRTLHISRRTVGFIADGSICIKPANSCQCNPIAGERWLAVGDAAIAFDPLSSMGISKALRMAFAAADAIQHDLGGDVDAVKRYADAAIQEFDNYRATRRFYYRQEQRWFDRPFWQLSHERHKVDPTTP